MKALDQLHELPPRVLISFGMVAFVLAIGAAARLAMTFNDRLAYRAPIAAPSGTAAAPTPHEQALADQAKAQAEADRTKPYVESEYRAVPRVGSRVAI